MKVGDLVHMKYDVWVHMKSRHARTDASEDIGIVYDIAGKGIKVLMPTGDIKVGLTTQWEIINDYYNRES